MPILTIESLPVPGFRIAGKIWHEEEDLRRSSPSQSELQWPDRWPRAARIARGPPKNVSAIQPVGLRRFWHAADFVQRTKFN
jgi:hypothetical protein